MNEQECLQRVIDILADNVYVLREIDGDKGIILNMNMDSVQMVAREICDVFKQPQKDTRSRRERALDTKFERMGVKPRVYHFTKNIHIFAGITIVTATHTWNDINKMLHVIQEPYAYPLSIRPATMLCKTLRREGIYGIAICNKSDVFSRHYGRMRAKGKLMQHLLEEQKK